MSWLFSRALVEVYSPATYSDGGQSAPSNTNHTPRLYSSSDRMTDFCRRSRSGMTCGHLTEAHGEAVLTSFLADFPVRTSAQREQGQESLVNGQDYGRKWRGSFAKFDPATSSWKIPHCLPLVGSMLFSGTWPRWGSMRNGACSELPMPELRTNGTGSGYWPSPKSRDGHPEGFSAGMRRDSPNLSTVVKVPELWPTPTVHGDYNRKGASKNSGDGLATAVKMYPPPAARDYRSPNGKPFSELGGGTKGEQLPNAIGGQLNPDWVEWLMGWPIGWTSLGPLNQTEYHEWQRAFRTDSGVSNASATDRFRRAL